MGKSHGAITLSFGKKCYNVTTPGDNLQISSTKRAFSLTAQDQVTASGIFPWSDWSTINTQCRPVFMSTKLVLSRVHGPPARCVHNGGAYSEEHPRNTWFGGTPPIINITFVKCIKCNIRARKPKFSCKLWKPTIFAMLIQQFWTVLYCLNMN